MRLLDAFERLVIGGAERGVGHGEGEATVADAVADLTGRDITAAGRAAYSPKTASVTCVGFSYCRSGRFRSVSRTESSAPESCAFRTIASLPTG